MAAWGTFLAYRGTSTDSYTEISGKNISKKIHDFIKSDLEDDSDRELKYGYVHYSEAVYEDGLTQTTSFKNSLADEMSKVSQVFLPLTPGFFNDFEKEDGTPNDASVTYHELLQALRDRDMKFIVVFFPGFEMNEEIVELLHRLYDEPDSYENSDRITSVNPIHFKDEAEFAVMDEQQLIRQIADMMVRPDYRVSGFAEYYKKLTGQDSQTDPSDADQTTDQRNIFLTFKKTLEGDDELPLYRRLNGVRQLTLLNFASTSFISGVNVSTIYSSHDWMRRWFDRHLANGTVRVNMILTNPHSAAGQDAALYKMRPRYPDMDAGEIILHNLNKLIHFKRKNPDANLNIYLTDVSLPYGIMESVYDVKENNNLKIDLYAPCTCNDDERPSFYLAEADPKSREIYSFFQRNLDSVLNDKQATHRFEGHPNIQSLLTQHILHRGSIYDHSSHLEEHTRDAFEACIQAGKPMEVDLLQLQDGLFLVARDGYIQMKDGVQGESKLLSECTAAEYYQYLRSPDCTWPAEGEMLTLDDFLELVHGSVPILLEIKTSPSHNETESDLETMATELLDRIRNYLARYIYAKGPETGYVAFHSSDCRILRIIKKMDTLIPCGLITMNYVQSKADSDGSDHNDGSCTESDSLNRPENRNRCVDIPTAEVDEEHFVQYHQSMEFWNPKGYGKDFIPDFISCEIHYIYNQPELLKKCRLHKTPILGWTITSRADYEKAGYYCDNLIVDENRLNRL